MYVNKIWVSENIAKIYILYKFTKYESVESFYFYDDHRIMWPELIGIFWCWKRKQFVKYCTCSSTFVEYCTNHIRTIYNILFR